MNIRVCCQTPFVDSLELTHATNKVRHALPSESDHTNFRKSQMDCSLLVLFAKRPPKSMCRDASQVQIPGSYWSSVVDWHEKGACYPIHQVINYYQFAFALYLHLGFVIIQLVTGLVSNLQSDDTFSFRAGLTRPPLYPVACPQYDCFHFVSSDRHLARF